MSQPTSLTNRSDPDKTLWEETVSSREQTEQNAEIPKHNQAEWRTKLSSELLRDFCLYWGCWKGIKNVCMSVQKRQLYFIAKSWSYLIQAWKKSNNCHWHLTCDDLVCSGNKTREVGLEDPNKTCGKLDPHNLNIVPTSLQCHCSHTQCRHFPAPIFT